MYQILSTKIGAKTYITFIKCSKRHFSSTGLFTSKTTETMKDLASLADPRNLLVSLPYSQVKLSHLGEINPAPTLNGKPVITSRDIRKIRGSALSELFKIFSTSREELKKMESNYITNINRYVTRGQLKIESDKGQSSPPLEAEFDAEKHSRGYTQAVSTSMMSSIARMFIIGTSTPGMVSQLLKLEPTVPELIMFDTSLLNGRCFEVGANSDYYWEEEIAIATAIPDTAKIGSRKFIGPIGISRFMFNELYIDIDLSPASFLPVYEKFQVNFEQFMKAHYKKELRGVSFTSQEMSKLIEMYVEIFNQYKKAISLERFEKLGVKTSEVYHPDKIKENVEKRYASVVCQSQTPTFGR